MSGVEQVIFTSAPHGDDEARSGGTARLMASGPGRLTEEDEQELARWAPDEDSFSECGPGGGTLDFFGLPSGAFCISRSTPLGWDSASRPSGVRTHCLVVPPEELARFANNPFAMARAAAAAGGLEPASAAGRPGPLVLPGAAPAVDQPLWAGSRSKSALVQWLPWCRRRWGRSAWRSAARRRQSA